MCPTELDPSQYQVVDSPAAAAPKGMKEISTDDAEIMPAHQNGQTPGSPVPYSPLGLVDRARLGWAKTPAAQKNLLDEHFGAANVALQQADGKGGFVVKDKDGLWKSADPDFEWKFDALGAAAGVGTGAVMGGLPGAIAGGVFGGVIAPSMKNTANQKNVAGDISQFAGQYGMKSVAAGAGAAQGIATAAPLIAASGPGAPFVAGAAAIAGAGIGAAGEDLAETGVRAGAQAAGLGGDAASLPSNPAELGKQLYGSFLFGVEQEAGNQTMKLGYQGAAKTHAAKIYNLNDTPAGKTLASSVLGVMTGQSPNLQRVRIEDPQAMIPWDKLAHEDHINGTDNLYSQMRDSVKGVWETMQARKKALFSQYDALDEVAAKQTYSPVEATTNLMDNLEKGGFTRDGKIVDPKNSPYIEVDIKPSERQSIQYMMNQGKKIMNAGGKTEAPDLTSIMTGVKKPAPGPGSINYDEMSGLLKTLDNHLFETDKITNPDLRQTMNQYKADLKNHLTSQLPDDVATKFADLDKQYGPVKDLMGELAKKGNDDSRVDTFLKQIIKDDGTHNADLLSNVSKLLGGDNPTTEILRMNLARKSTDMWSGHKVAGIPIGSPAAARAVVTGVSNFKQGVGNAAEAMGQGADKLAAQVPYLNQVRGFLGGLSGAAKKSLLGSPETISAISQGIAGLAAGEKQATEQILQQTGVK